MREVRELPRITLKALSGIAWLWNRGTSLAFGWAGQR